MKMKKMDYVINLIFIVILLFTKNVKSKVGVGQIGPEYKIIDDYDNLFTSEYWKPMIFPQEVKLHFIEKWKVSFCTRDDFTRNSNNGVFELDEIHSHEIKFASVSFNWRQNEIAEKCKNDKRCESKKNEESRKLLIADREALNAEYEIISNKTKEILVEELRRLSAQDHPPRVPGCVTSVDNTSLNERHGKSYEHLCLNGNHGKDDILVHEHDLSMNLGGKSNMETLVDIILEKSIEITCLEVIPSGSSMQVVNGGRTHQFVRIKLMSGHNFPFPSMIKIWGTPRGVKPIHEQWHKMKNENSTMDHWRAMKEANFSSEVINIFEPVISAYNNPSRTKREKKPGYYNFGRKSKNDQFLYRHNLGIGSESESIIEAKFEVKLNQSNSISFIEFTPYNDNYTSFVEILNGGIMRNFVEVSITSNGKHGITYIIDLWG